MKAKQNIGIVNALIRITFGFTILSWSTAKLVKKPWRDSYILLALMGAMKVGEGILRYCPLTALYEKSQEQNGNYVGGQSGSNQENERGGQRPRQREQFRARPQE
ncbi:DUF2892 domain-containing protein [Bacillus sp. V5-8f]|uniref:YgaP family membrane protein n=1 Tax=Bacillus sp. V5-8f TaxID=2053044 RepID=UPI000C77FDC8|nr:DUF2892 domain-containing protein [Bacillus sp. V5-8f]PLT33300.1 DUF2892 domain-containing protein [Bacillus sp. V5-8f]